MHLCKIDKKWQTFKAAKSGENCSTTFREQKGLLRNFLPQKLVSSAFTLLFTEISIVRGTEISVVRLTTEISVPLTTEISVKSSAKADETS